MATVDELRPDGFGRYRYVRPLARGGMAELVLARTTDTSELVVIKRILSELETDADSRRMFEKEVGVARRLAHPNIARMLDAGTVGGAPYIALEHVRGCDLRRLLAHEVKKRGALELDVAIAIAMSVLDALTYAHEQAGILHRDIDPSNVVVALDGGVKLVDFGIARAIEVTRTTRASWFKGKAGYVAPEQCLGERVDARTDVFAVGVLLYEMTTGYRAFHGTTEYETTNLVLTGAYARPSTVVAEYPRALEEIVCRALATDPDDRFASARAFGRALRRFATAVRPDQATKRLAGIVQDATGDTDERRSSATRPFALGVALGAPVATIALLVALAGGSSSSQVDAATLAFVAWTHATERVSAPPRPHASARVLPSPRAEPTPPSVAPVTELASSTPEQAAPELVRRRPRRVAIAAAPEMETVPASEPSASAPVEPQPQPAPVAAPPATRANERPSLFPPSRTNPWDQIRSGDTSAEQP